MLTYYAEQQAGHAPLRELNNGEWMDFAESPARLASILDAIGPAEAARDHGDAAILAVHDAAYVDFLRQAHTDWLAEGRTGDALGYAFPVVRRRALPLDRIDARLGLYGFDAATPIAAGTYGAAYWGVQSALSALGSVAAGTARQAFALCRPPGHHSGRDYCGGYCYFNNAAIVAEAARAQGLGPVAILDVDYHHGNGTQDIFYDDSGVFFVSIHADPVMDYPYFWGHADETGAGNGVGDGVRDGVRGSRGAGAGATLNLPLPRGTVWPGYAPALARALDAIAGFGAKFLVVSYGADTFAEDPISHFKLTTPDMGCMGEMIAQAGLPVVCVMEGGYNIAALGANVQAFLAGLES